MKTVHIAMGALIAAALAVAAIAEEKPAAQKVDPQAAFERIKSLQGEWEVTNGDAHPHLGANARVTYKVTAGGNAVLETLFPGTDHEMITLYYPDGDDLALTHYCILGNRPLMRAEQPTSAAKIHFVCGEAENSSFATDDHMHEATLNFVDADHLKTEWVLFKAGKADSTHTFELARKKK